MIVTMFSASYLAILMLILSWRVISARREFQISFGDKGNKRLERRMRAFGNFIEYTPMGMILIMIQESWNGWPVICAALLLFGRSFHAVAFMERWGGAMHFRLRRTGMWLTFGAIIFGACANIYLMLSLMTGLAM